MTTFERANALLNEFKGKTYLHGANVLPDVGQVVARAGKRAVLVRGTFADSDKYVTCIRESLSAEGVYLDAEIKGARPNAPREDVARIAKALKLSDPDTVISFGGGSTIDAVKAAEVLRTCGGGIEDYLGSGLVTEALSKTGGTLSPHVAIQTAASSAAHLTKYSNITDLDTGQKNLIVDGAVVPKYSVFDHAVTYSAPLALTIDGALDGISHCLEVLYGSVGGSLYAKIAEVAITGIELVVDYLPRALSGPLDREAREALCLATDLGGYAIMLGGTNGGHLTSFSLVDILSHGRACAIMNPYYTVFFSPAVEEPLRLVGDIYRRAGYTTADFDNLQGQEIGVAVAEAMLVFAHRIGFPTKLNEVPGFTPAHIERALTAAKSPQLRMKLQNMPVPLAVDMVDEYMGAVLEAATVGDLGLIKSVQ